MHATDETTPQRYSPLRAEHEALGASFTDFGGWMMPVRYGSDLAEHHAVRRAAGLFDISHMGELVVTGAEAASFLDFALASRLSALPVGRAKYTMILASDGGIIDDLIVYRLAEDQFLVIANAGNTDAVREALVERVRGSELSAAEEKPDEPAGVDDRAPQAHPDALGASEAPPAPNGVIVEDVSDSSALIAVQGPAAQAILESTPGIEDLGTGWGQQRPYGWTDATYDGSPLLIARTGYTGEDGFELLIRNQHAAALWRALRATGEPHGLVPAGLAARDTLRLEAGMPLYDHELSREVVPAQAGLGGVIPADKTGFIGEAAKSPRTEAPVLVGLVSDGRRAGRAGYAVLRGEERVGVLTSGALSPTLGHPIAMAFIDPSAVGADDLTIDVRGTRIAATTTALPFYRRKK
ncbi:glycine cleavage system aminomethyltransferase GcvT [Microbacterium halotolerans]|uniref:glycine cleavage system aminomethyltransferase GcvT n=1 Tax=Microbacterium halotolerans TaxID=246613 RepID=UPI000E6A9AF8|nr:glycine cleavage system aminomethyltransferase GcvT [Microbacterium halotolerans]